MAVGRTELTGTATPVDDPVAAPFSDEPCLYADRTVEEHRDDPDDSGEDWVTIAQWGIRDAVVPSRTAPARSSSTPPGTPTST